MTFDDWCKQVDRLFEVEGLPIRTSSFPRYVLDDGFKNQSPQTFTAFHKAGWIRANPGAILTPNRRQNDTIAGVVFLSAVAVLVLFWGLSVASAPRKAAAPDPVAAEAPPAPKTWAEQFPSQPAAEPKKATPRTLVIEDWTWQNNSRYSRSIVGHVFNNEGKTIGYAIIEFQLLDRNGSVVGTAWDSVSNLRNGQRWRFDAFVFEDSATRARLVDIRYR